MGHKLFRRLQLDHYLFVALVVISFASLWPFIKAGVATDYDARVVPSGLDSMMKMGAGYKVSRMPGSPSFELSMAYVWAALRRSGLGMEQAANTLRAIIWILACVMLFFFQRVLRKHLDPWPAFFACLALVLHSLYLWLAWALVEDMFAVSLAFLGWYRIRFHRDWVWGALLLALAVTAKATAVAYVGGAFVYLLMREKWPTTVRFGVLFSLIAFFVFLPALADMGMDIRAVMQINHYGTSPHDRPAIAWMLVRACLLFYLPALLALLIDYGKQLRQTTRHWVTRADPWIFIILPFFFMQYHMFHYRWVVGAALVYGAIWLWRRRDNDLSADIAAYSTICLTILWIIAGVPYSQSYLLPALPAVIVLLARRFRQTWFWVMAAFLSFAPMFYFFTVRLKPPFLVIYDHGLYVSHLKELSNEYNDFGLLLSKKILWPAPKQ